MVGLDSNFLGHLHENLEEVLVGVVSQRGEGRVGVSGDLGEDLAGSLLEERRLLKGNDQSTGLVEGINHGVVVSGALLVGSDGLLVGIVSVGEVALSLSEDFFFTSLVGFVGRLFKTEVGEIGFTFVDLTNLSFDLLFVADSGGVASINGVNEVSLGLFQGNFSLVKQFVQEDNNSVNDVLLVI